MKKTKIHCQIKYKKESERPKIDFTINQLKSEGWKIDGPELHKDGLDLHVIYMKRILKNENI